MALVLADRVNETTTTTGTGTVTLAGAVNGYQSFAAIGNGNTTYYTIVHQTLNEWEVGIGTYTSVGTTLSRSTILASSNSGLAVSFSAGTKFVFCDYPAGRAVYLDSSTNVTVPQITLSSGTANGVLYLNGSKVATSGSALTFDGTALDIAGAALQRLGFYNSSAATDEKTYAWQSGSAVGNGVFRLRLINDANSDGVNAYVIDRTGTSIDYQAWSAATSEGMRLTSTGLGVGTSSPGYKLDVSGTGYASSDFRAPIFYDSSNTVFYVDPSSSSVVSTVYARNSAGSNWKAFYSSYYGYSSSYGALIIGDTSGLITPCINVDPIANPSGSFSGNGNEVMFRNGVYFITPTTANTSYHQVLQLSDGNVYFTNVGQAAGSLRAPIFYDSDNTGYYVDPAGTSNLGSLTLGSGNVLGAIATFNNMNQAHGTQTDFNNIADFGVRYVQGATNGPSVGGSGSTQFYGFTLGLGSEYSYSSYASQIYWPRLSTGGNPYISVRFREGGSWGSWSKIWAGYADSAGSAGSVDFNNLTNKTGGTGTYTTSGDFRAPIFYDSNDTNYYGDFASTSVINTLRSVGYLTTGRASLSSIYGNFDYTTANGYLITTNIDYSSFNMPTVIIEGYAYGNSKSINLSIVWYSYAGSFTAQTFTNYGSWDPGVVRIGVNGSGKVCIHLSNNIYYGRMNVRCVYDGGSTTLLGWSIADASYTSLSPVVIVPQASISSSIYIDGSSYVASIYDINNTAYYLDPASTSLLYTLSIGNYIQTNAGGVKWDQSGVRSWSMYPTSGDMLLTSGDTAGSFYVTLTGGVRSPIFYDSSNTAYYVDPNSNSSLYNLSLSNYANGNQIYPGIIISGNTNYNYNFLNGTWAGSIAAGFLANCADQWEFAIHDSNERVVSPFIFIGGVSNNYILMGRDIGWGTTYIQAASSFRAPIFYDSDNTAYYVDPASTSVLYNLGVLSYQYISGQTINGQSTFQWEGATYRNPGDWTAHLLVRRDNSTTGINGHIPALVIYNNNGGDQTTAGISFASAEAATGAGNSVALAGIIAKKEAAGNAGGWSPGSLTFYVKDYGTRRDGMYIDTSGYVRSDYSFRAPIFYDSDNTGYYVDPASTSNVSAMVSYSYQGNGNVGGTGSASWHPSGIYSAGYNWLYGGINGGGASGTNFSDLRANIFYDYNDTGYYLDPNSESKVRKIWINNGGAGGVSWSTGLNMGDGSNYWNMIQDAGVARQRNFGTGGYDWFNSGASQVMTLSNGGTLSVSSDMRAPIFYDSNNTGYYTDPASTSNINSIQIAGVINQSGPGRTATVSTSNYDAKIGSSDLYIYTKSIEGGVFPCVMQVFRVWDGATSWPLNLQPVGSGVNIGSYGDLGFKLGVYGSMASNDQIRAPIFYDYNDTGYYLDPNSTSNTALRIRGGALHGPNTTWGAYLYVGTNGNVSGTATVAATDGNLHIDTAGSGYPLYLQYYTGGYTLGYGSVRSPIFYDLDNTGYYADPANTTNLNLTRGYYWWTTYTSTNAPRWDCSFYVLQSQHWYSQTGAQTMYLGESGDFVYIRGYSTADGSFRAPIFYDSNNTSYYVDPNSVSQLAYVLANDYFRPQGSTGIYWNDYAYYFDRNPDTYGNFRCGLNPQNSYVGIQYAYSSSRVTTMFDSGGNGGLYNYSYWIYYWNASNACLGVRTSSTSSSYSMYVEGGIYATGNVVAYSDARKKTNIVTVENALDTVGKLRGVFYNRIQTHDEKADPTKRQLGVIAQEVNEVLPEVVTYAEDVDEYGVQYGNMAGLFIEAIKELKAEIEELKRKLH